MKTLLELSEELVERGYTDLFDHAVEGEILDLETMTGSHGNWDSQVYFKIIKLGEDVDECGNRTHLDTLVEEIVL